MLQKAYNVFLKSLTMLIAASLLYDLSGQSNPILLYELAKDRKDCKIRNYVAIKDKYFNEETVKNNTYVVSQYTFMK